MTQTLAPPFGQTISQTQQRRDCNLLMVWNRSIGERDDFEKIAAHIREIDPHITPRIVDGRWDKLTSGAFSALRPTLIFSPFPLSRFRSLRGHVATGIDLSKSEEYSRLEAVGLPVPQWQLIQPNEKPDLADYGSYVVTKPNRGGRGAMIKIKKAGRVRYNEMAETESASAGSFRVAAAPEMMAQQFIYTGKWPTAYRVTTLFGKVLYSLKIEASRERTPLPSADAFGALPGGRGVSIVASGKGCAMSLNYDEEIIALGEAAHAAFPDVPLLGVDIVREVPSGKLFVLEVNAIGYILHFSSQLGKRLQREFGFNLEDQFDGLRKAAHILAAKTQELAR